MMNESQITVGELSSFLLYAAFVGVSIGGQIHSCSSGTRSTPVHFNGHFSRWTWVSRYQSVSILDFVGAGDDGGGEW